MYGVVRTECVAPEDDQVVTKFTVHAVSTGQHVDRVITGGPNDGVGPVCLDDLKAVCLVVKVQRDRCRRGATSELHLLDVDQAVV